MFKIKYVYMNEEESNDSSGGVGGTGAESTNNELADMLASVSNELGYSDDKNSETTENDTSDNADSDEQDNSTPDTNQTQDSNEDASKNTTENEVDTTLKAPSSWKPEVAAKWSSIDPDVRAEIERRESNYHEGIKQYQTAANLGHSFHTIAKEYVDDLEARGINALDAVNNFFQIDKVLTHGTNEEKLNAFIQLARHSGINFDGSGNYEFQDQTTNELKQEIQTLKQQLSQINNRELSKTKEQYIQEVNAFASNPSNKHFNTVAPIMERLIKSGSAKTLEEAYNLALNEHPTTRQLLIDEQVAKQLEAKEKERLAEVEKAKKLKAANTRISNRKAVNIESTGDLEKDIAKSYKEIVSKLN